MRKKFAFETLVLMANGQINPDFSLDFNYPIRKNS